MGRSQQSFSKKEKEKKRRKRKEDKLQKKEERKSMEKSGALEDMLAYVDAEGNIIDSPPENTGKKEVDAESIVIGVPKKEKSEGPELYKGRVEYFNDSKGFGFIRENEKQEKYFFHVNGLIDEVAERDRVQFHLEKGMKGLNAVDVEKI